MKMLHVIEHSELIINVHTFTIKSKKDLTIKRKQANKLFRKLALKNGASKSKINKLVKNGLYYKNGIFSNYNLEIVWSNTIDEKKCK